MTLQDEMVALRLEIESLANDIDNSMLSRYALSPRTLTEKIAFALGKVLQILGLSGGYVPKFPWSARLKHGHGREEGQTMLIWAVGHQRERIRSACDNFSKLLYDDGRYIPVLVTDVADFSYYSRLGWMVEYLPRLSGKDEDYFLKKCRYLAWRYRDSVAFPLTAGFLNQEEWRRIA